MNSIEWFLIAFKCIQYHSIPINAIYYTYTYTYTYSSRSSNTNQCHCAKAEQRLNKGICTKNVQRKNDDGDDVLNGSNHIEAYQDGDGGDGVLNSSNNIEQYARRERRRLRAAEAMTRSQIDDLGQQ